eukprot:TRINITY_DN9160_c0_g1_i2.p1 TRINITY_DN9160_c0_g1~~TRINITY_DN9160_c0_g1_i2.p1  ORF type:complete len:252 (+),score=37.37 TRINITY_DN9160_c0_g1_i2:143-898(+)
MSQPMDYIVDVVVITKKAQIPPSYEVKLAFKRGQGPDKDPMVITGVTVIADGRDDIPEGYEALNRSVEGRSANLNQGSGGSKLYLCLRRQLRNQVNQALMHLVVVRPRKGEQAPPGFHAIPRNINEGSLGDDVRLAVYYAPIARGPSQHGQAPPTTTPQYTSSLAPPSNGLRRASPSVERRRFPSQAPAASNSSARQSSLHLLSGVFVVVVGSQVRDIPPAPDISIPSAEEIRHRYRYSFSKELQALQSSA